ncbi:MAG: cytochrome c oxidase assembly protein [Chloroflexota bacterium]
MRRAIVLVPLGLALLAPAPALAHGGGQGPPPTDALGIALAWHLDIPIILGLLVAAALYVSAIRSVDAAHPANRWSRRRTVAFLVGLVAIGVALLSPIDTLSDDLLSVHMLQHLLMTSVAAPLFAASGLGTIALRVASPDVRGRYLLPFLHSRLMSALTFPVVGLVVYVLTMWATHFTTLYNLALLDDGVHALEHLLYLVAASLFWWPLLSPDPLRWRIHPGAGLILLAASMPAGAFLGVTIMSAPDVLYPAYLGRPDAFGIDALADQAIAGAEYWAVGGMATLAAGAYLLVLLMRHEEAETKRVDALLDRNRRTLSRKES